ncbi:MAG: hypothetical protein LLG97_08880 [Deltaproteobacteria bacterium]|nr:hypothetical protein [Deltaproteobacteria bacterium]
MAAVRTGICVGVLSLMWVVGIAAAACLEISGGDADKALVSVPVEDGAVIRLDFINSIYLASVRETLLYESGKGLSIIRVESPSPGVFEYYRLEPDSPGSATLYRHVGAIRLRSHDYENHTLTVGPNVIRLKGLAADGDPLTVEVKDCAVCKPGQGK